MTIIRDGLKFVISGRMELYGQNPIIEKWLENKTSAQIEIVRQFITFLSDNYPDMRTVLYGPPKSVEEWEEK